MREPIDKYIIDKVRKIRLEKKISQETIAIELGFESNAYISAIESMSSDRDECYNSKHLNQIAKLLKCSPKEFWPDEPIELYVSPREKQNKK